MEKKIKISPKIASQEDYIMRRLHGMIRADGNGPFKKDSGYNYQLDSSNDWWAKIEGNKLVLACRYPYQERKLNAVAALCRIEFNKIF